MKKLIAILAVFAVVAGAAFAQDEGSWSVGSNGEIGTQIDFLKAEMYTGGPFDEAHWKLPADKRFSGDYGEVRGNLSLTYKIGGLSTGFNFNQNGLFQGFVEFYGDGFGFGAKSDLTSLTPGRAALWGNYNFNVLNGLLLEISVADKWDTPWETTTIFDNTYANNKFFAGDFGQQTWNANYLKVDLSPIEGLNVGFKLANLFDSGDKDFVYDTLYRSVFGAKFSSGPIGVAFQFALKGKVDAWAFDSLTDTVTFGSEEPKDGEFYSALYLGATYKISDQMDAGLEFRGEFGGQNPVKDGLLDPTDGTFQNRTGIKFGGYFNFNDGPLGAGVTIKFEDPNYVNGEVDLSDPSSMMAGAFDHDQTFAIEPSIRYDLVEGYLQFKLGMGFTFKDVYDDKATTDAADGKPKFASVITYSFTPQLYFNFLGTGAGNWDTGMAIRYIVAGPAGHFEPNKGHNTTNALELGFKWKF